jgi:acylpyruvate hydrolase
MRFATIRTADGTRAARVDGDELVELAEPSVDAILRGDGLGAFAAADGPRSTVATASFAPLVTTPDKIVCLGLNYDDHIRETNQKKPEFPTLFAKFTGALVGARDAIELPEESRAVDWEAELAFVIGRRVRNATGDEAAASIAGFTVANDVSMRDWQRRTNQSLQGKTWERSTPVGPWLATPDEVGGTEPHLAVCCEVDGLERQCSNTKELVFKPVDIVAYVSTIITLEPGDLVLTGTPSGVGAAMDPPVFLSAGQTVRTEIEGIGELVNVCVGT